MDEEKEIVKLVQGEPDTEESKLSENISDKALPKAAEASFDTQSTGENKESNKKLKKPFLIGAAVVIFILAATYLAGMFFYKTHFFPETSVNGLKVKNMNSEEAAAYMDNTVSSYTISVKGRDSSGMEQTLGTIDASDIDMTNTVTVDTLNAFIDEQNAWMWPIKYLGGDEAEINTSSYLSYDEDELKDVIKAFPAFDNKTVVSPENAYISDYSETLHGYEIIPEVSGNEPDIDKITDTIIQSLSQGYPEEIDVQECYASAEVTADDAALNSALDEANKWVSADIEYDWNGSSVSVNNEVIKDWISFENTSDGRMTPVLDEEAVTAFVKENAKANDTYGKKRSFTTTLGTELTLPSGAYGWKTDTAAETEALINSIENGETISKEPEYTFRGANKGSEDIGSSYVEIDLSNQHLYLYEDGAIVLETDFVSGNMSNGNYTPQGVFGITYKTKNAVLRGADYETPVNYWMPFNGNVGMHDATWRSSFGGDIYLTSGSHGCVNLPLDMAAQIYEYMSTGFPVICYYY